MRRTYTYTRRPPYHRNENESYSYSYWQVRYRWTGMGNQQLRKPAGGEAWMEYVHGQLAVAGFKRGGARDRIIGVMAEQSCALSAIEIEDALRAEGTPIARASVYRILELLVEYGLVERVVVGEGQTRFEPVHPSGEHHHHLICDQCGRLVAFDDPALERAIDKLTDRLGVRVESHEILLRGDCGTCS
jgi:Fur family transcriptional regulator, ferric uptake regulator